MSVIRLQAKDQARLVELASKILDKWRAYSDESVDVLRALMANHTTRSRRSLADQALNLS